MNEMTSMLDAIPTLPVNDAVSQLVEQALELHGKGLELLRCRNSSNQALRYLAEASELSLEALHHPTMVSMLYFPDEFKAAMYLPYLLPVLLPLVKGFSDELKIWRHAEPPIQEPGAVSYTHLRAHETPEHLVCRLLLEKKKINKVSYN
eukprot:TRINITY_DN56614_c0_g1_i1.p1 TRINITY_DN56614_c0_g1~~TRINITY_DN56614_c0_g1_i1.p1  ORF type:complete len:149 (+),score=26.56 TRINITY_DN56614_c0_g1_i1:408-854(+)